MLNSVVKARQQVPFSHLGIAAVYIALRFLLLIFYFWGRVHMCADSHLCLDRSPVGITPPPETDHLVFLHKSPHQTWDLLIQLDWLPSKPQRPSCLCPPAPGFQVWAYHAQLFKWVLWIKFRSFWSDPHVYMTNTLLWAVPAHSTSLYGVYYLDNELSVCLLPIIHLFM